MVFQKEVFCLRERPSVENREFTHGREYKWEELN